ncbi:hypothetical protein D6C93_00692 [Aureobasidium pullulans]|nr:hypothetical protein D6C93_00692 [Aureobasidium pullulans]
MDRSNRDYCLSPLSFDHSRDHSLASPDSTPNQATIDSYLIPASQQNLKSSQDGNLGTQSPPQNYLSPTAPVYSQRDKSSSRGSFGSFVPFPEQITDTPLGDNAYLTGLDNIALPQSEEDLHTAHERQCAQPENGNYRAPSFYSSATYPEVVADVSVETDVYSRSEHARTLGSEEDIRAARDRRYSQSDEYQNAEEEWKGFDDGPHNAAFPPYPPSPCLEDAVHWYPSPTVTSVYSQAENINLPRSESGSIVTPEADDPSPGNSIDLPQPPPANDMHAAHDICDSQPGMLSVSPSIYPPLPDSPSLWVNYNYHADSSPPNPRYTTPSAEVDTSLQIKTFSTQVDAIPAPLPPIQTPKKRTLFKRIIETFCFCHGESGGWAAIDSPSHLPPVPISPSPSHVRPGRAAKVAESRSTSQAVYLRQMPQTRPYRASGERLRQRLVNDFGYSGWGGYVGPVAVEAPHHTSPQETPEDWRSTENNPGSDQNAGHGRQTPASHYNYGDQQDRQCNAETQDTHNDLVDQCQDANHTGNDHGDIGLDCGDGVGYRGGGD